MNAEEYLKQELSNRELWNTETDDCYQVLSEIMQDYDQSRITKLEDRVKELEEALENVKSINVAIDYSSYNQIRKAIECTFEIAEQALNKK